MTRTSRPRVRRPSVACSVVAAATVLLAGCAAVEVGGAPVPDEQEQIDMAASRTRLTYGALPDQFGEMWLPAHEADSSPLATVVLLHGGFWRDQFRLDLMDALAVDLVDRGFAVWNVEYRRVGGEGGFPATFADVAAAVDHLADIDAPLDLDRVVTVGHSAGGHLAVWAAGRRVLPAEAVGAAPIVQPCGAVSQAGVLDLETALRTALGGGAAADLLGADAELLVAMTSPVAMAPLGVPVVLMHGDDDQIVPRSQSDAFVAVAPEDSVIEVFGPGDHFTVIDPSSPLWERVADLLPTLCTG